jgi:transposase
MWTKANRGKYNRDGLRYPSDLTNAEWGLVEPLIPPAKHGGRRREVDVREVLNGLLYVLSTGCQWRAVPKAPAAQEYAVQLFRPVELGWHARPNSSGTLREMPRGDGTRGQPDGGNHRQPERQRR